MRVDFYVGNFTYLADFDNNKQIRMLVRTSHASTAVTGSWVFVSLTALDSTGIGPESFAYISADGSDYILRPEVLESNFYAWRVTGDTKYLDNAAAAIDSFNKFLPATVGFAGIDDVNDPNSEKIDDTESFWFAEVLKYLYLTFDDPEHISLDDCESSNDFRRGHALTTAISQLYSIRGPAIHRAEHKGDVRICDADGTFSNIFADEVAGGAAAVIDRRRLGERRICAKAPTRIVAITDEVLLYYCRKMNAIMLISGTNIDRGESRRYYNLGTSWSFHRF
ncbi:glycoside hydrolase family protein [Salix suchowensis]|nr:glycoside hydrolase family protein [Salix suchowensis]